jgi:hypothetical protein
VDVPPQEGETDEQRVERENDNADRAARRQQVLVFKPLDLHGRYPQQGRRWGSP